MAKKVAGRGFMPSNLGTGCRMAGDGMLYDDYSEESGNKCNEMRRPKVKLPLDNCDPKSLNGPVIIVQKGRNKDGK